MTVVGIGDRISWFANQSVILIEWAVTNWKGLFLDYFNLGKSVFTNLAGNIKSVWGGLMGWFKGEKFSYNWKPLMDGFQSSIKEAPAFQKFVNSDLYNGLAKQLGETDKEFEKRAEKWQKAMDAAKPDKKKSQALVDATIGLNTKDLGGKGGAGGGFTGLADAWKKAQENVLKSGADRKAEQDRTRTREATERTAKATEKIAARPMHAVAG